jgi:hypothetical protein
MFKRTASNQTTDSNLFEPFMFLYLSITFHYPTSENLQWPKEEKQGKRRRKDYNNAKILNR